jgi:hypothetical protein
MSRPKRVGGWVRDLTPDPKGWGMGGVRVRTQASWGLGPFGFGPKRVGFVCVWTQVGLGVGFAS